MPFLRYVRPEEADGIVKEQYELLEKVAGFIPNITQALSLKPSLMVAHQNLFRAVLYGSSNLSRADREMVAAYVSKLNDCHY